MNIQEEINSYRRNDYQRDNFDAFLKKVHFSYEIPSIHVTGTNGKGSTCNYIASIYKASGLKVGLFTSPYYKRINEMIKVGGEEISDPELEKVFKENQKLFKKYELSSFEICSFIAFEYFKKESVDVAIIECGMGGELDATNIFTPILSIITSVSIEHTNFLGVSLSEIALHKAGIIKREVPVLLGNIEGEALDVIASICHKNNSKIVKIGKFHREKCLDDGYYFDYQTYENLHILSHAKSSVYDAMIALDAVMILLETFNVDEASIKEGLSSITIPARFALFNGSPTFIVDGAHNPEAIHNLREDVDSLALNKPIHVVFASFRDKNITNMLPEIALLGDVSLTTFDHLRARNEEDYFLYLEEYKFYDDHVSLLRELKANYPDDVILVTGSLAFAFLVNDEIIKGII